MPGISEYATFKVAKKLYDSNVISRATFASFKKGFEDVVNGLQKTVTGTVNWDAVRDMFDFRDYIDVIPINAANLCPSIHAVQLYVNEMGIDMNRDVSIQKRTSVFSSIIDDARALIAQQLNIATNELAFMRNTTEANCIINNGLDFNAGDEVVIWKENHGTNNRAWEIRQQRFPDFNIVTVDTTGATTAQELIDRFMASVTPGVTRVVTFSEVGANIPLNR